MVRITLEQYKRLVAIENPSSPLVPALLRPKPPPSLPSPQICRASSSDHPVVPPPPPLEPPLVPGLLALAPAREPASSSTAGATARPRPLSLPGARGGARRGKFVGHVWLLHLVIHLGDVCYYVVLCYSSRQ